MRKDKVTLQDIEVILGEFAVFNYALDEDIEVTVNAEGKTLLKITNTIANGEIDVNAGTFNGKTRDEWAKGKEDKP